MPLIQQRATATLVDSNAMRFLTRYDVALESLRAQDEAVLNAVLEAQLPPSVEASLDEALRTLEQRMERLAKEVVQIDPTLEGASRSTLSRMQDDLKKLHGKIIQAAKRKDETLRRQFQNARSQAFPGGEPQERAVGFVYFLEQVRPGAGGSSVYGVAGRCGNSLGRDDIDHWLDRHLGRTHRNNRLPHVSAAARRCASRSSAAGPAISCTPPPASRSLIVAGLGFAYFSFSRMIDERLHGERERTLPRVYARPAEFRRGQTLSQQDLIVRLNDLGYADRPAVKQAGEFSGYRNVITLAPRGGELAGKTIKVTFPAGRATQDESQPRRRTRDSVARSRRRGPHRRHPPRSAAADVAHDLGRAREAPARAALDDPRAHAAGRARDRGSKLLLASRASIPSGRSPRPIGSLFSRGRPSGAQHDHAAAGAHVLPRGRVQRGAADRHGLAVAKSARDPDVARPRAAHVEGRDPRALSE